MSSSKTLPKENNDAENVGADERERPETPERKDKKSTIKRELTETEKLSLLPKEELIQKFQQMKGDYTTQIDDLKSQLSDLRLDYDKLNSDIDARISRIREECRVEIEKKDKNLKSVSETNKRLLENLESLNHEVDEKLDKGNIYKKAESKMKSLIGKREKPLDIIVKVKEKELKNVNQMLDIVKRDKEILLKEKEEKDKHPYLIAELQDKLHYEEKRVLELQNELKSYQKPAFVDERKRFEEIKASFEKERKQLKDELQIYKDKIKQNQMKLREDESARNSILQAKFTEEELAKKHLQVENDDLKFQLGVIKQQNPELASIIETNLEKLQKERDKEREEKEKELEKQREQSGEKVKKVYKPPPVHKRKISQSQELSSKEVRLNVRSHSSLDLTKPNHGKVDQAAPEPKIFTFEEKAILQKLISKGEVEKYEKRFLALEHAKLAIENKSKLDLKSLQKRVQEFEEHTEYLNILHKELEQKNKMLQYQINESKSDTRISNKKNVENSHSIEFLTKQLKEKEQENKILTHKLNVLKRLSKHNALAPLGVKSTDLNQESKDKEEDGKNDMEAEKEGAILSNPNDNHISQEREESPVKIEHQQKISEAKETEKKAPNSDLKETKKGPVNTKKK